MSRQLTTRQPQPQPQPQPSTSDARPTVVAPPISPDRTPRPAAPLAPRPDLIGFTTDAGRATDLIATTTSAARTTDLFTTDGSGS